MLQEIESRRKEGQRFTEAEWRKFQANKDLLERLGVPNLLKQIKDESLARADTLSDPTAKESLFTEMIIDQGPRLDGCSVATSCRVSLRTPEKGSTEPDRYHSGTAEFHNWKQVTVIADLEELKVKGRYLHKIESMLDVQGHLKDAVLAAVAFPEEVKEKQAPILDD